MVGNKMKLISLNTWGGQKHAPLMEFFKAHQDVDIFSLQEIYHEAPLREVEDEWKDDALNLYADIKKVLPGYQSYFRPNIKNWYGLAFFIKKDLTITEEGEIWVYEDPQYVSGGNHPRNLHYVTLETSQGLRTILNIHGIWNGEGKSDSEHRLKQSDNIVNFLKNLKTPHVLSGDFNLLPETESIKKLEQFGLRNLIKEYGVTSTRTSFYPKPNRFADYVFVSNGITVKDFKVLPNEVSDHSPLALEFE
jgi:endonuclease/exonuclease/phosphatase family metal-dependent hydrolase